MSVLVMLTFGPEGPLATAPFDGADAATPGPCCNIRRPMLEAEMEVHGDVVFVVTSCHLRCSISLYSTRLSLCEYALRMLTLENSEEGSG
jgi:hypothetical protein